MTRPIIPPIPKRHADPEGKRVVTEPALAAEPAPAAGRLPRATTEPSGAGSPARSPAAGRPAPAGPPLADPGRRKRPSRLPYARHELVNRVGERAHLPAKMPRATGDLATGTAGRAPLPRASQPPSPMAELTSGRVRARGTPGKDIAPGEQVRTLIYAPEAVRAAWVENELSHAPITIQIGRSVSAVVAALVKDPPPRPEVLVVDFEALSTRELAELHAIRQEGWPGRLIGLGNIAIEVRASLRIDEVLEPPLVHDTLLDCVAGTRHSVVTTACPVLPKMDEPRRDK
ncbi:MAG: hypothetical protein E6J90_33320 [Deltaproteobacteria bacterium]|nr:MAG: hypothetical protein E6J90_33320 [Deltaproteobacteria bacterium]